MSFHSTQWHFYTRTDETWKALKEAFINARKTIDIEEYILERDAVGQEFLELLIKKRQEGVRVRILCDMAGSYGFFASSLPETLQDIGIEVKFFNIIKPWRIHSFFSWFFRDHRKLIIVDGNVGFVGGVNIRKDMRSWRDTHVRVTGPITKEMQNAFHEMWFVANERKFWGRIAKTKNFVKGFQFITNSPNIGKRYLYQELIQAIRGAKNYIYLTTPYFVPDRRMRRVLRLAAKRGVEVKILVPKTSNYPLVDSGSHAYYDKLISSGIRIFQYYGELLHAKTAVIDDTWATIGSFNLDSLSFLYNFEANIVSTNALFAKEIREYFENDMTSSQEVSLSEWRKRSTTMKIKEFITLPIRRFL